MFGRDFKNIFSHVKVQFSCFSIGDNIEFTSHTIYFVQSSAIKINTYKCQMLNLRSARIEQTYCMSIHFHMPDLQIYITDYNNFSEHCDVFCKLK